MTKIQPTASCLNDRKNYAENKDCAVFYNSYDSRFSLPLKRTRGKWGFLSFFLYFFQVILTAFLAEVTDSLGNEIGADGGMGDAVIGGSCINFSSLNIRTENWVTGFKTMCMRSMVLLP